MLCSSLLRRSLLRQQVDAVRRTPAYLRHAPPGLYITCDFERNQRHITLLVDASSEREPPLTNGIHLLASSGSDDISFREARSILFGSPAVHNNAEATCVVDGALKSALTVNHMALPFDGIQAFVIPEFNPLISHIVKELLTRLPHLRIACSPLTAAFLSDKEFFNGVVKALCQNDPSLSSQVVTFANVAQESLVPLEGGSTLPALGEGRKLQMSDGDLTETRERWRRERKNKLKHFESYALFMYDPAFQAVHIPSTSAVRVPWAPLVVPEVDPMALLVMPDFFSANAHNASPLLEVWRLREQSKRVLTALRKFPETQRVLTTAYGEIPGGVTGYVEQLRQTVEKLEELRNAFGTHLATDTERDMKKWSSRIGDEVLAKCLVTRTPATKTEQKVMEAYKEWVSGAYCDKIAGAIAHASAVLPPDPEPKVRSTTTASPSHPSAVKGTNHTTSTQELRCHFEKQGMASLCPVLEKENIDVAVFLAMTPKDFKDVFKATFGLTKKMQMLQEELRASQQ
uniref:Uncharacterized protein TCIL3000_6_1090 n=1 Tax=Trypanosoma congolense (strain IL3000) TaxID=1068625 RepID=G0UNB7_TRYCI|nr:unnamed protein product [Trypanosoma congolense IL3000]